MFATDMTVGCRSAIAERLESLRGRQLSPEHDPWDPYLTRPALGGYALTSIEVTTTHLCHLRCRHCAVGHVLVTKEDEGLPVETILAALDEVDTLLTLSITGGEPLVSPASVKRYVRPLLRYARQRRLYTQVNTTLTLPLEAYLEVAPDIDVIHISFNYEGPDDFVRVAYAQAPPAAGPDRRRRAGYRLYERLVENLHGLAERGYRIAAETIMTTDTLPKLHRIHGLLARLGTWRHEVHPLYPSDFAASMALPSLDDYREGVHRLLDHHDPSVWLLFGTLPFFPCSPDPSDRALLAKLHEEPNTTVRNDPDGRCRLNVDALTGLVQVSDFADCPPLGRLGEASLPALFQRWLDCSLARQLHCHCPAVRCLGPNVIVAQTYYPDVDFQARSGSVTAWPAAERPTAGAQPLRADRVAAP